jgi:hypothetical protein
MKADTRSTAVLLACLGAAWLSADVPRAEVSVRHCRSLLMDLGHVQTITDGADPIPHAGWEVHSGTAWSTTTALNPAGAARPDGRPDLSWYRGDCRPFVAWAYKSSETDHDIAWAQWTDAGWSTPRFLTNGLEDERDPRAFVEADGTVHVAWWVDAAGGRIMLASREPGEANDESTGDPSAPPDHAVADNALAEPWSTPLRVTAAGETGSRPSVAAVAGELWVAWERASSADPDGASEIVIARQGANGTFGVSHVAGSDQPHDLDVLLTVEDGRLWVTWVHSDTQLAASVFDGEGWRPTELSPWAEPSWIGLEQARAAIRHRLRQTAPVLPVAE